MIIVNVLSWALWIVAGFWSLYLLAFPLVALLRPSKASIAKPSEMPSIAIVIPAHNAEQRIGQCLASLKNCRFPEGLSTIYVITDHCTDKTEKIALQGGAVVLSRNEGLPGKTYALAWGFDELADREVDADLYVIVDATAYVGEGFLTAMAHGHACGEDIIVGRASVDLRNRQWFARNVGLSLVHRSLQNWARECLGLSSLIQGCAMAYSKSYIGKYRWSLAVPATADSGTHPTEDWRHGVRAVEQGIRIAFADDAVAFTPLRDKLGDATRQGMRWERGRVANATSYGVHLLQKGIRARSASQVIAALDAIQPPVAILGGICVSVAVAASFLAGNETQLIVGLGPLLLVAVYGLVVLERAKREGIQRRTLLWVPVYIVWRCIAFALALSGMDRFHSGSGKDRENGKAVSR